MIGRLLFRIALFISRLPKVVIIAGLALILIGPFVGIFGAEFYKKWDNDPDRGGKALAGALGESFGKPEYLKQGWDEADSLWFYTTTQGSAFLPYDFFLALEQADKTKKQIGNLVKCNREAEKKVHSNAKGEVAAWFSCDKNMDRFRYLTQKTTHSNPDGLPVGFAKETYTIRDDFFSKDYIGFTCAACHTGQINHKGRALRIDGGPSMAYMTLFMKDMAQALQQTLPSADPEKNKRFTRFAERVIALNNDYGSEKEVVEDLEKWTNIRLLYNNVNRSYSNMEKDKYGRMVVAYGSPKLKYGYARLDAFGRIYNRVIQHAINAKQMEEILKSIAVEKSGREVRLISDAEVNLVLKEVLDPSHNLNKAILGDQEFWRIYQNLISDRPGYPKLTPREMLAVRNVIFNTPNAPVSMPFLWDITRTDYVQWNGLANNAALGSLGRNTGEVIGVFAILDWHEDESIWGDLARFSLAAFLSGQSKKKKVINFQSSVDLFNLRNLERHLANLMSPKWPFCKNGKTGEYYLPSGPTETSIDDRDCNEKDKKLDSVKVEKGKRLYDAKCLSCHVVIDREAWDRLVTAKMRGINQSDSTDKKMAENSVTYAGKSGNFKNTYQEYSGGTVIVQEDAPVAQILTSVTKGVVGTPDADKWWPRRMVEYVYTLVRSYLDTPIKPSVKSGKYNPDTTSAPYASLASYRARSLNGIWATAPYLHNGSVPTLLDLLSCRDARPQTFGVGQREFDPIKVGFRTDSEQAFEFNTSLPGNENIGHEYGVCSMTLDERKDLLEYLKYL